MPAPVHGRRSPSVPGHISPGRPWILRSGEPAAGVLARAPRTDDTATERASVDGHRPTRTPAPPPAAPDAPPAAVAGIARPWPPLPQLITELRDLVVTYVKQQTRRPAEGSSAATSASVSSVRCSSASVSCSSPSARFRVLQTETGEHVHRRLVVGAVPDHDRRAGARRGAGLVAPRRPQVPGGGLMTIAHRGRRPPDHERRTSRRSCARSAARRHEHRGAPEAAQRGGSSVVGAAVVARRVPARPPPGPKKQHHRRGPAHLMPNDEAPSVAVAVAAAANAARVLRRGWVARFSRRFATIALRQGMRSGSHGWLYARPRRQGVRMPPPVHRPQGGGVPGQAQARRGRRDPRDPPPRSSPP